MPQGVIARRVLIVAIVCIVLLGTHWLAYWFGGRTEHNKTASSVQYMMQGCDYDALRIRVEALQIMVNHENQFSAEEIKSFCAMTNSLANSVEYDTIIPNRKAGNDPEADRGQKLVDEARRLVAKFQQDQR